MRRKSEPLATEDCLALVRERNDEIKRFARLMFSEAPHLAFYADTADPDAPQTPSRDDEILLTNIQVRVYNVGPVAVRDFLSVSSIPMGPV